MTPLRPKSRLAPAMIVAGALAVPLALYVAGYFLSSNMTPGNQIKMRLFAHGWQRTMYSPMATIEAKVTGVSVLVFCEDAKYAYSYDP